MPGEPHLRRYDGPNGPAVALPRGDVTEGVVRIGATVRPATRLLDAYNTAMHWVPLRPLEDVWPAWHGVDRLGRLGFFADAYGLDGDERCTLPDLAVAHARRSRARMRTCAERFGGGWARMWDEGVGDAIRRREEWLEASRADLLHALGEPPRA